MNSPCPSCNSRPGYPVLEGRCTRCARDIELFRLGEIRDQAELAWADYADLLYRIEVHEGLRPPPIAVKPSIVTDRPDPHGVQREAGTRVSSPEKPMIRRFSPSMKQGPGRSLTEDDLT